MRLESDLLVSSLKQKLGHYHPCLLDWNVLRLVLRAWSSSGETVTPGHMLRGTWCTRCSWRTGARGELGRVHTGPSNFGVHLILVFPKTPSPCLQKELGWVALACYPAVYAILPLEFFCVWNIPISRRDNRCMFFPLWRPMMERNYQNRKLSDSSPRCLITLY